MVEIRSAVPGRIRLGDKTLRTGALMDGLSQKMVALGLFSELVPNPKAGSLVLIYAPEAHPQAEVVPLVRRALGLTGTSLSPRHAARRRLNRGVRFVALGALGLTAGALVLGAKGVHKMAGTVFFAAVGTHIVLHRRQLWK